MNLQADINFLYEMSCLKHKIRDWEHLLGVSMANHAEHIFHVAWIALIIAKHEGVNNTDKILKLALVHDVSESRSVDVSYLTRQYVTRHEDQAIKDTFSKVSIGQEFITLWKEYELRESIESQIVKDADNLDVDMELKEQAMTGLQISRYWQEMRDHVAKTKLYTQTAKRMYQQIKHSNPYNWHLENNRYTSGDWKKDSD